MNLEKLLTDQGGDPLTDRLNGRSLRAFINANLKRVGAEPVEATTPSDIILERIYAIEDADIQTKLLERAVAELSGDTNYKRVLMYGSIIITAIVAALGIDGVTGGHLSPEAIDALKTIGSGIIQMITSSATTP